MTNDRRSMLDYVSFVISSTAPNVCSSGPRRIIRTLGSVLCLLVLLAAGCGQQQEAAAPAATQPVATQSAAVTEQPTATPVPTPVEVPEGSFQNPILEVNFPDPGIIQVDDVYYAFATNGMGKNVPTARSTDLVDWELLTDAMPALARWVNLSPSHVWAPEVIEIDGRYVLYYTARDKESDRQCIGVATSDQPEGKYLDTNAEPFICQVEEGGSIDAHPFQDEDGTLYLYWKNDGNCCSMATYIYVQELAPDGLSLVGEPTRLIRNDQVWEGSVVEAPTMWLQDGDYYLFYSANGYAGLEYSVGYAVCEAPTGPCEKPPENRILESSLERPPVIGPGHQEIVVDDEGQTWMMYHAWEVSSTGLKTDRRFVWLDQLVWEDGKAKVEGPTTQLQPMPVLDEPVLSE